MSALDYRTAGESHGRAVICIVEGLPAGLTVDEDSINAELARRQGGYGRGARQRIEADRVEFLSGLRAGVTIGSPITMQVVNKDHRLDAASLVHRPQPGHADLAGSAKWLTTDCRGVRERASARETVGRTAAGALAKCLLWRFDVEVVGFVVGIGSVMTRIDQVLSAEEIRRRRDANQAYCPGASAEDMIEVIRRAEQDRDTVGGVVEVRVYNLPPGLGSCMRWQDRLDGRLMQAVGSVQAIKGVEIGLGFECAALPGSKVHDEIDFDPARKGTPQLGFTRRSNNAGGIEGGMTNGQPVVLRAAMKPISTLPNGLASVNLVTGRAERADYERSDVCAVPAAGVVIENVVAFEIARVFCEKFAGDTMTEMVTAYTSYLAEARALGD